jgi:hypothetical protein
MRWIVAFLACIGIAQAQIIQHQIYDDGYARVPLQFAFPYHGRVFTESYMFSNGVVGFLNPDYNSWCCTGFDLRTSNGTPFNFAIMPLQTDLINYGQGRFLTEGTPTYQRYVWENISEYGVPNNLNTFGVEIRPSGYIGMHYEKVNISTWRPVTIGRTGDTSLGEYTQYYHGAGFSSNEIVSYITQSTGDLCLVDPLSSPSCAGYAAAYLTQQCSLNALYDRSCPGYEAAYLAQQCSLNTLYDTRCPGYTQAYFDNQCRLNALYDASCPGYAQAYFNQQCTANALYDRTCPGYAEAYALAHVVSTPTVTVSAPTVQVNTTGTVTLETPVVSDPVVNEVITRPTTTVTTNATSTVSNSSPTSQVTQAAQTESKTEKKTETKQVVSAKKPEAKTEVTQTAPVMVDIPQPVQPVLIVDMLFKQMVKKPIQDNNRSYYALIMGSQKSHEEMVNEQYRRKGRERD